jgi:hypothetical protein
MILYNAGNLNPITLCEMALRRNAMYWLETNAHRGSRETAEHFIGWQCAEHDFKVFIDSGAFTAWSKGTPINHDEYITYMKFLRDEWAMNKENLVFASLDVIPGSLGGGYPTPDEFRAAAEQGWQNYLKEKREGVKTIPTFHQGDPWEFLERMIDDTDYIGLSPRKVGVSTAEKAAWLNLVFQLIDKKGKLPQEGNMDNAIKTHGLGVSSPVFMEFYPWYSVDSTRWIVGGRTSDFFHFDGSRICMIPTYDWGGLKSRNYGETSNSFEGVYNYKSPDVQRKFVYYFHEKAIQADVACAVYMTEIWEGRGVVWK